MTPSPYIRAMHPKTAIRPDRAAIKRVLDAGWTGQLKIHGHRAQIHVCADASVEPVAYTRQGRHHTKALPPKMIEELRRLFKPETGWNVIDAEWLKATDELFVFDMLKREGRLLSDLTYLERYELLPRVFSSEVIRTLPLLRTIEKCMEALASTDPVVEGIVLKALGTRGFNDTSIIRCRRSPTA